MGKRHGAQYWRAHVEAWRRSDLTQRGYCAKHELCEKSFYRWRSKEKETIAAASASLTPLPISVGTPATSSVVLLHSHGG
jgi:hypothetical protein